MTKRQKFSKYAIIVLMKFCPNAAAPKSLTTYLNFRFGRYRPKRSNGQRTYGDVGVYGRIIYNVLNGKKIIRFKNKLRGKHNRWIYTVIKIRNVFFIKSKEVI